MTEQERLEKAKAKSLAHHFTKAAAHHKAKADAHEKLADAHKAHAEHHAEMAKTDGIEDHHKEHHKASAAFHKSKAAHHEKLHKAHKAYAAHHESMAAAHSEEKDAEKIYKGLGIEEDPLPANDPATTIVKTATPTPAPTADKPTNPSTPAAPVSLSELTAEKFDTYLKTALDKKLSDAANSAFERLLNSEDFAKRVDQEIAKKMLEKLGATTIDTPVRTFPVPRPGEGEVGKAEDPQYENVPMDLLDLIKSAE